jgi:hypothetical protein
MYKQCFATCQLGQCPWPRTHQCDSLANSSRSIRVVSVERSGRTGAKASVGCSAAAMISAKNHRRLFSLPGPRVAFCRNTQGVVRRLAARTFTHHRCANCQTASKPQSFLIFCHTLTASFQICAMRQRGERRNIRAHFGQPGRYRRTPH